MAKGKNLIIDIVCKYELSNEAKIFYAKIENILKESDVNIKYRILDNC